MARLRRRFPSSVRSACRVYKVLPSFTDSLPVTAFLIATIHRATLSSPFSMTATTIMREHVRSSLVLLLLLLFNLPVYSQDRQGRGSPGQGATTMSVDVNVVTLPVTVRDKKGQIVRNLAKDDFVLQEDSRPQVIKYFAQDT